ncbi:MAG: (Fe-S)-binding protein [Acetobacter sp.]|jgi:L-lactate dehydrogenase complex protein LldE|nr:(Fe-S)-binding protein [Acetobacter sp.]MCH4061475.1 (Fe-S)-binding protein [Acetobacter sp.]MCI1294107.1 (Fe-S)-binding protein [Acetobacter sp.]MCI1320674.1 (Fe-S)-binding protein [Acetobacter sp.]MCI1373974.1 (Fe-S)-binding protein [Acetobacter sp.]
MKIGLFVPCYVDALHPEVGIATLELLERFGLDVVYPPNQTCCGQPMSNTGCEEEARATEALFVKNFSGFDYVVAPSGSCVRQVRDYLTAVEQTPEVLHLRKTTFELVEFLHDVLKVDAFPWAEFPHRVAIHNNCGALRGLRIASMSERREPFFSKPKALLSKVSGIEFCDLERPDECCGFGGTFSVFEEGISAKMGQDKVEDQIGSGAEYVTSSDSSCMMHQEGCARRMGADLKYIHIAQILNGNAA